MIKTLLVLPILAATFAAAQSASAPANSDSSAAQHAIEDARKEILEHPAQYVGYNLLATGLVNRAAETSDGAYLAQAEEAVKKSLELAPNNYDTEKVRVSVLLGEHDFPAALDLAKALNKQVPDDVMVYGLLTDANVALGNYGDAENSAQWMLNLRPGNLPALIRAAHLRELFGDAEGAYELMDLGLQSTAPTETEQRAWTLAQMGHLRLALGNVNAAERLFQQALMLVPECSAALSEMARVRVAQKRYSDAAILLQQRYQSAPSAANLYEVAEALQSAGREAEAKKAFVDFESRAAVESGNRMNANRELIFYYADHAQQPDKALTIARQEFSWRHDVYTLDAYAWALHMNEDNTEARKQIEAALAVGIRDGKMFLHAGTISLTLGDAPAAERYFKQAAELNNADAERARFALARITAAPEQHSQAAR